MSYHASRTTAYQDGALGPDVAEHLPYGRMTQSYRDGIFAVQAVGQAPADCLGPLHAILATECLTDPSNPACVPLIGADNVRQLWRTPICPEIKTELMSLECPTGGALAEARAAAKACLDDPGSSPICAFMAHPEVLENAAKKCPEAFGDLAPKAGSNRMLLIGAGIAAAAVLGFLLLRRAKSPRGRDVGAL